VTRLATDFGNGSLNLAYMDHPFGADQFYGNFNSWEDTKTWFAGVQQALGAKTSASFSFRRHSDLFVLYRDRPEVFANHHADESYQLAVRRREEMSTATTLYYGVEAFHESIASGNLGDHARSRVAGYAAADFRALKRFSLTISAREEIYRIFSAAFTPTVAGGVWLSPQWKVRASTSRAFRVPSYTELLARRYKGRLDPDADEFIAFAVDGANRMQRLIEDLLMFSRVGTRGTDLLGISSEEALQQALINLRGSIEESGAVVTHDLLPEVLADETQLIQLFQNLVGNAVKYRSSAVPRVNISAAIDGQGRWSFAVADNGLGIEPQYFEKIFGMFQRLHKREEYAGTGIGLDICKKIVERHGGAIYVESQPGQGSTFTFTLASSGVAR